MGIRDITMINGETMMPLNKIRQRVMSSQAEEWMRDLHNGIQEALEYQIKALRIDYESPAFMLQEASGRYSERFKRVVYASDDNIAEEYYWDETLLVRVKKDIIHDETGQGRLKFTIEVPRYGEQTGPAG